ncbi:MAG: hypothetical protein RL740_37 [Actinomycetota bacterium]|jgi:hypothetical protein
MMQRTCKKFTQLILFTLLATLLLTGCSASQQYAGSKKDGAFFAIPNGWFQITNEELNKEEAKSTNQDDLDRLSLVTYQVGFSAVKKVTPEQVFLLDPTPHPVVFARFRDLFPEERNSISLNALRNVILPVTDLLDGTIENTRNFQLIDDQEVVEKGATGVNLVYSFDFKGINETINQTALYSNDKSKIFLFIARCTTKCYNKNVDRIEKIVNSFTVRGAR